MNKPDKAKTADLLIELGCEELPPKSLPILAKTLFDGFVTELNKAELEFDAATSRFYYTDILLGYNLFPPYFLPPYSSKPIASSFKPFPYFANFFYYIHYSYFNVTFNYSVRQISVRA